MSPQQPCARKVPCVQGASKGFVRCTESESLVGLIVRLKLLFQDCVLLILVGYCGENTMHF